MTHGFITIATGDVQYYKMAENLLRSYRRFSKAPLPFAILADRMNEYTAEFDDVQLMPHAHRNYLDKLEMFGLLPYDVNIFVDADCLAYGDMNRLFDIFGDANDFSCFGRVLPLDDTTGWFEYKNLGKLQQKVSYVVGLHGGIYYMRKTERCKAVLETARELVADYEEYQFKGNFTTPGDEPLVALSMAINGCKPIPHDLRGIMCYWEHIGNMRLNLPNGIALAKDINVKTDLLHWGTRFTRTPLYRKQINDLHTMEHGGSRIAFLLHTIQYGAAEAYVRTARLAQRGWNKIMRVLHIK